MKVLKWVCAVIVGLIIIGIFYQPSDSKDDSGGAAAATAASGSDSAEQAALAAPLMDVTADELAKAYDANTVAADQRFKGVRFKVHGTVGDINTDMFGNPYVTLHGGVNEFMEPQFQFDESQKGELAKLKKGAVVTLICTGQGDVAKTPMSDSCTLQ